MNPEQDMPAIVQLLPPYNKPTHQRRTRTPRDYAGTPLHLHRVPGTVNEWCAFAGGVEVYVMADDRQEAKQAARRKTPGWYGELTWRQ